MKRAKHAVTMDQQLAPVTFNELLKRVLIAALRGRQTCRFGRALVVGRHHPTAGVTAGWWRLRDDAGARTSASRSKLVSHPIANA